MLKRRLIVLLVLLLAFALRSHALTQYPPGLTHDEANHGREAMGILDGNLLFYFPLNYGSEPLYSYTVAGSMRLFGEGLFALRLVNLIFGLAVMALAYLWTAKAFDRRTALLAMAITAVSFWPIASSRQALRAGMLPFFMAGAVYFFWQLVQPNLTEETGRRSSRSGNVVLFAFCVAITLHIYLAARVAWVIFPLFMIYLALVHPLLFRRAWRTVLLGLILAGLLTLPMFSYLDKHPEALTRLDMLDGPLQEVRSGNLTPILANAGQALLAFVWPGSGDKFLAYNIPGRPVFDWLTAGFFLLGWLASLWRWRQPRYALLLLWFVIGIAPSLLTGATANTTRNLAALSAAHLFPAIGFLSAWAFLERRRRLPRPLLAGLAVAWIAYAGGNTIDDYFRQWGKSPEVRGAYQHTLLAILDYLEQAPAKSPVVLSSVYPGAAHDPSIQKVLLPESSFEIRWTDSRHALILPPGDELRAIVPASTPPHPLLAQFLQEVESVELRPDDLDPSFAAYRVDKTRLAAWPLAEQANFNNAIKLLHAEWDSTAVLPGASAELVTVWQVTDPSQVGPIVPPIDATDVVFFTQVLDQNGQVLTQRDALDAPSWDWQVGDLVIQVHAVTVPAETAAGSYDAIVGIYDRLSGTRLNVFGPDGQVIDTRAFVTQLQIGNP